MISVSEALKIILDQTSSLTTEKIPLASILGRTLGRDIVAKEDLPPFDNSSMDGFAIAFSELHEVSKDKPRMMKIVGESSAGNMFKGSLGSGQAVRIMTGGALPKGADSVVPIEQAEMLAENTVQFLMPPSQGQCVRRLGEDIRKGEVVLRCGQRLTPGSIGVLASLGCTQIHVYKRPGVNILATGNELVNVADKPGRGQIRNSSSYALAASVAEAGGVSRNCGIVSDDRRLLYKKITKALTADVLLITGGVSVGRYDYVKDILADVGVEIVFWKVNIKPGMPLVFGKRKKTLVFGLPGNPVSTGVTFLQFVRPALLKLSGRSEVEQLKLTAVLDQKVEKFDGKRHYVRGIVQRDNGELHVATTGTQSSGAMSSLAKANCLIIIPEEVTRLDKGAPVEIELL